MPKSTVAGHPLHPQLIAAPTALLPFSLIMDLMHLHTGKETYAHVANHALMGGMIGGAAAAAAGLMDYLELPRGGEVARTADVHASLNAGVLALYGVNAIIRSSRRTPSGRLPTLLSAIGTGAIAASAWYGGHMVYEQGVRVKGRDPIGDAPEATLPGDALVEDAFSAAEVVLARDGRRE